jgi:predicted amino acid racemase
MNARLEVDLGAIEANTRSLVDRLAPRGIRVTGVTKASLGSPGVGRAMIAGGAHGLGDSRVENLARLGAAGIDVPLTLIRSPMTSQVDAVVRHASTSLNTEISVLEALSRAASRLGTTHAVVLMVELGDLREGVVASDLVPLALDVAALPGLTLAGIGTNLACQSGVVPDQTNMCELSRLADEVERAVGARLCVVSGGNSANVGWALDSPDTGLVDDLRLGEAILLGLDPLTRLPIAGLRTDAMALAGELIEVRDKPAQPWGVMGEGAFGAPGPRPGRGLVRQGVLAVGRQDVELEGLRPPSGVTVLGMSSDHLVVDLGDVTAAVGDELRFGVGYGGLLRAMTSPFVDVVELRATGLLARDAGTVEVPGASSSRSRCSTVPGAP